MMTQLRVEFFYDHEVDLWGYSVPVLNVIGTGCLSREDAERYVLDAIEFTFEEEIEKHSAGAELVTYDVTLTKVS